jgi:hypothetical protein
MEAESSRFRKHRSKNMNIIVERAVKPVIRKGGKEPERDQQHQSAYCKKLVPELVEAQLFLRHRQSTYQAIAIQSKQQSSFQSLGENMRCETTPRC